MEIDNVHILFIDDNLDVIDEARFWLLEEFGYQYLETATSSKDAQEKLEQGLFDVIVADMRMEKDDSGFEILDWVNDNNLAAVTIVLTANDSVQDCRRAFKSRAWDYISKNMRGNPFEALDESIKKAIAYLNRWPNEPNQQWFEENKAEIEEKYWGQWVAIANKAVLDSADTKEQLAKQLEERQLRRLTTTLRKIGDLRKISDLLQEEESLKLEFKSSLRWDVRHDCEKEELQKEVLKTIVAFLNTEGGTLLIGVEDNRSIFGIEKDCISLKAKQGSYRDEFQKHLINLIRDRIGTRFLGENTRIRFETLEGKDVCAVYVRQSDRGPAFLKPGKGGHVELYIRMGNTTQVQGIPKIYDWL
ncbi:MAG: response regulator [Oscillatoria sp. SIO1A7]|nr:response regulator [Oscillatoria sp. SIO1A7]